MDAHPANPNRWAEPRRPEAAQSACVRARSPSNPCDRCASSCPTAAITFTGALAIGDACSGCGACVATCPHDVFRSPLADEIEFGDDLGAYARDARVRVACVRSHPVDGELNLPCLGRLSASALFRASLCGVSDVTARSAECARCEQGTAVSFLAEHIELARSLAALAGRSLSVSLTTEGAPSKTEYSPSRRGLFRALMRAPSSVIKATSPARSPEVRGRPLRLQVLATLARERDPDAAVEPAAFWPFGHVTADGSRCLGCPACAAVCSTRAIRVDSASRRVTISFDPARCTACKACVDACRTRAISVRPATPDELGDAARAHMVVVQGRSCPRCGRISRDPSGGPCDFCRGGRLQGLTELRVR